MKEYLREIVQRAAPRDAVPEGGLPDGGQSVHKGEVDTRPPAGFKADVERFLERPAEAWTVEREAVLDIMAQRGWRE